MPSARPSFTDLATATYCPRQLYYDRREGDREPPPAARDRIDLAFRYPRLQAMDDAELAGEPIDVAPAEYRERLARLAERPDWAALCDPPRTRVFLAGKDARGVAHKLLRVPADDETHEAAERETAGDTDGTDTDDTDEPSGPPPVPVVVSPGDPPDRGVWEPQSVRAVAAMHACSWVERRRVRRAIVEYPAHAVVRTVRLTVPRAGTYRRALRTVRGMEGPPSRLSGSAKCRPCRHRERCGVRTRSLRSLLGL